MKYRATIWTSATATMSKGGFKTLHEAVAWIGKHNRKMACVEDSGGVICYEDTGEVNTVDAFLASLPF